jgi:hypothetical protein
MSKFFQLLLSGMFFTFFIDFFLFLGMKINYIDKYNIPLYYNIFFVDNQNIFIFLLFSIILGYIIIYGSNKLTIFIITPLFLLSLSTLKVPIGHALGELILMKKDVSLQTDKFSYHGDIIYNGRKSLSFYDYKIKKVLTIQKYKIKGEY